MLSWTPVSAADVISHVLMYSYYENEDKTVKLDPVLAKRWSKQQARVSPTKLEIFGAGWHCRYSSYFSVWQHGRNRTENFR